MTYNNYHDRGMKKWSGFILSEHAQREEVQHERHNHVNLPKPQQTLSKIEETLHHAFQKNQMIAVQLEAVDANNHYYDDIIGKILGSDELGIYIGQHKVGYDEIRHVSFYQQKKWSDCS